jgi:hypothetical protein
MILWSKGREEQMTDLDVQCHEGQAALKALANPLSAHGLLPAPLFMMDPEYLAAGLEGSHPSALVAYQDGRPIAYMPYVIRAQRMRLRLGPLTVARLPYRQLRLLGYQSSLKNSRHALNAFFSVLTTTLWHQFDVVLISELPLDDPLSEYLAEPAETVGRSLHPDTVISKNYRLAVEGPFDGYLQRNFSRKTRHNLRNMVHKFGRVMPGAVVTRVYQSTDQVAEFLREAEAIARRTYQWRLGYNVVRATPEMQQKMSHFAQRGRFRGYILFAGDTPCAYGYGVVHRRTFCYEVTGYDDRLAKASPGTVLFFHILEDLFASGLVGELDFGAGEAEYKRMFATSDASVFGAELFSRKAYPRLLRGLKGTCRWLTEVCKPWAARLLRRRPQKKGAGPAAAQFPTASGHGVAG